MAVALCLASLPVAPISLRLNSFLTGVMPRQTGIDRKSLLAGAGMSGDWACDNP
ncbi:hypothetical protein [Rhodomicrobium vannielii]|uniref:hypothetical protein n=1 Tax=Rhodomicrobium vannielii TaxID=1069 RepID=UPI001AEC78E2|nr:hypothetical protein [Rhodomicrobium vannielii]